MLHYQNRIDHGIPFLPMDNAEVTQAVNLSLEAYVVLF